MILHRIIQYRDGLKLGVKCHSGLDESFYFSKNVPVSPQYHSHVVHRLAPDVFAQAKQPTAKGLRMCFIPNKNRFSRCISLSRAVFNFLNAHISVCSCFWFPRFLASQSWKELFNSFELLLCGSVMRAVGCHATSAGSSLNRIANMFASFQTSSICFCCLHSRHNALDGTLSATTQTDVILFYCWK